MIASSYLRVFRPLDALPERERVAWERYIVQGEHLRPLDRVYRQRRTNGRLGLLTREEDRADVRLVAGRWYVCPWRTRLRVLASLLSLREQIASEVADALVPEDEARRAARELARIRRRDPGAVPTLLQSHFHVPVRWFALFGADERSLVQADGSYRIRYWTRVPEARSRAGRAMRILRAGDLAHVAELVGELDGWLSSFDDGCAVELDYGAVADLFSWSDLDEDHSAAEVQGALDALEIGDLARAGGLYQQVAGRWADAQLRESLN